MRFVQLTILIAALPFGSALAQNAPAPPAADLAFDGFSQYVEIADSEDFSVSTHGGLTIAAWMRPDAVTFPSTEGSGYVHWLGKGDARRHEWVFRMYSDDNTEGRANRISFYVFNPTGGLGVGSYFEDPVTPGEWIHVVGVADQHRTYIYKNGVLRGCNRYDGQSDTMCQTHPLTIVPAHGTAPVRFGTRDFASFFLGALAGVRIYGRALSAPEVADLFAGAEPSGLVAFWPLDDGAGSVAADGIGGHDGAIIGGASWEP